MECRAFLIAQLVKNPPAMQETWFSSLVGKIPWRRDRLPNPVFLYFFGGSNGKESTCNVGDLGLIPGLGRSPGRGHGNPLQYSYLENLHGQRSLSGYSPWGYKESGTTVTKHSRAPPNISKIYLLLKCTQSIYNIDQTLGHKTSLSKF